MAITQLTDCAAMTRCLSEHGISSFSDNDRDGWEDSPIVDEVARFSTAFFAGRLAQIYDPAILHQSLILQEFATIVACRTLCTRRGNPIPESLELRYQEIVADKGFLDQIVSLVLRLVDADGNVLRSKLISYPSFSNLTVDRRYPNERIRVVQQNSMPVSTTLERDVARLGGNIDG